MLVREPFKMNFRLKNRRRTSSHTVTLLCPHEVPCKNPSKKTKCKQNKNNMKPQSKTRTRSIQLERPNSGFSSNSRACRQLGDVDRMAELWCHASKLLSLQLRCSQLEMPRNQLHSIGHSILVSSGMRFQWLLTF